MFFEKKKEELNSNIFDFNFKLVIIEELLDKNPSFESEVESLREKYDSYFDNDYFEDEDKFKQYVEDVFKLFDSIKLTEEDLLKVEALTFDGGLEVYQMIVPEWDGEDERFDVTSIKGIEHLTNLKYVEYIFILDESLVEEFENRGIEVE